VGILVSHFQRPIPPTHTHTHKAARPQAEREPSNKNIGRKAASLVGIKNSPGQHAKSPGQNSQPGRREKINVFMALAHGTI